MRLGLRLGSAAVLLVALAGAMLARGPLLDALAAAALVVACWEFSGLMRRLGAEPLPWLLYPLALFLLLRHTYPASWRTLDWALGGAVVIGLIGTLVPPRQALDRGMARWAASVGGALYLGLTIGYLLLVVNMPDRSVTYAFPWLVAIALGSAMVGDTAALFVGSAIGRHRFFPSISPKKTAEGAAGSLLATVLTWSLLAPWLTGIPVGHAIVLGVVVAVAAMGGDLVESALKRAAGVKDSSELIPGHGGLLDRLDSLLLIGPVVYAYVVMTGLP
ncbi:MAG TPA: phosphatidate cytidylyltransferase [Candidatus Angelobacter sp.]|jgi:phosphatidate cytidylyltransferase|nr:phosphatidate cytidylyltransferase [Candidatus Angelobacter sp.]